MQVRVQVVMVSRSGSMVWASCLAADRARRAVRCSSIGSICSSGGIEPSVVALRIEFGAQGGVFGVGEQDLVGLAPAGELDVGGLAGEGVGADCDGEVPGAALGAVGGECVGVGEVAATVQVGVVERDVGAAVECDPHRVIADCGDGAGVAVRHRERPVVEVVVAAEDHSFADAYLQAAVGSGLVVRRVRRW